MTDADPRDLQALAESLARRWVSGAYLIAQAQDDISAALSSVREEAQREIERLTRELADANASTKKYINETADAHGRLAEKDEEIARLTERLESRVQECIGLKRSDAEWSVRITEAEAERDALQQRVTTLEGTIRAFLDDCWHGLECGGQT